MCLCSNCQLISIVVTWYCLTVQSLLSNIVILRTQRAEGFAVKCFFLIVGLKEFLEESEAKLQTVFDSACGFWNIHGFLLKQIEYRINDVASMKVTAGKLLNTTIDLSSNGN